LDPERTRLAQQLNELEIAERVLARFGQMPQTAGRSGPSGRTASAAPEKRQRRARGGQPLADVSLSDATLRAVEAHGGGASISEVLNYLTREFGMTVRPNRLDVALKRHRRAGRLEDRDQRWHLAGLALETFSLPGNPTLPMRPPSKRNPL
jgi:hypothetical protein